MTRPVRTLAVAPGRTGFAPSTPDRRAGRLGSAAGRGMGLREPG